MLQSILLVGKVYLLLFHFIIYCESYNIRKIDQNIKERIDKFVENVFLPSMSVGGCGLAVLQNDGQHLYATGYGYADYSRKIPNGNQTQFLLASASKSISAVVIVKTLHERFPELDEAVLDTPIRKLMPKVNFTLNDRVRSEQATFRDLLSHKTCLPREDLSILTEPFNSTAEILYRQRYAQEACGFRTKFVYNNQMILLAADLIGKLVNENFAEYTEIFMKDLGMHDSAFIRKSDDFTKMVNRAMPYYNIDNKRYPLNPDLIKRLVLLQAIGGLYVTPNDMARYIRFQLNMGEIDGKQIVPKHVMSWLSKPSNFFPRFRFKKSNKDEAVDFNIAYGLGLAIGTYDGWERIGHNGKFNPYNSEMSWYPALKIGIFSSTHESPNLANHAILHTYILDVLRGNKNAEEVAIGKFNQKNFERENEMNEKRKILTKFLGEYMNGTGNFLDDSTIIGKYGHKVYGLVEVFNKYNTQSKKVELYVSHGKWVKGWLEKIGSRINEHDGTILFGVKWDSDIFQDNFAIGEKDFFRFVTISKNGILSIMLKYEKHGMVPALSFSKGVETRIEHLDPVPWKSDRCE